MCIQDCYKYLVHTVIMLFFFYLTCLCSMRNTSDQLSCILQYCIYSCPLLRAWHYFIITFIPVIHYKIDHWFYWFADKLNARRIDLLPERKYLTTMQHNNNTKELFSMHDVYWATYKQEQMKGKERRTQHASCILTFQTSTYRPSSIYGQAKVWV